MSLDDVTTGGAGPSRESSAAEAIRRLQWFELVRPAPSLELDLTALAEEIAPLVAERLAGARRVAVTAGSRGIARLADVVGVVVRALSDAGIEPVIVPAMGSHGGGTPSGQIEVLHELGVDAAALGASVDASMDVVEIGAVPTGQTVYLSSAALACDAVVPVGRVKPHTDFRAPIESGLVKMLTIGLGKHVGASSLHEAGFFRFVEVLPAAVQLVLERIDVPFGVALLEDAWHRLRRVEVVPGTSILEREPVLLREAWQHFARLPFSEVDLLVMKEMGKTVSGGGLDPNVIGRFPNGQLDTSIAVQRLVVLDLREDSAGNAIGVGMADVVSDRLVSKIDWVPTSANALASKSIAAIRLPFSGGNDLESLALAAESLVGRRIGEAGVVAAVNTLAVDHLAASEPLLEEAVKAGYELVGGPQAAEFAPGGSLRRIAGLDFFAE